MSILCTLFGHRSNEHVYSGGEYMHVRYGPVVDGIGREHFDLYAKCRRCGKEYRAGRIHGHQIDAARNKGADNA